MFVAIPMAGLDVFDRTWADSGVRGVASDITGREGLLGAAYDHYTR